MRCRLSLLLLAGAGLVFAQSPVAPTDERVGEARGVNYGNYNILQSWEVGYRFRDVDGNLGKYRSDVNYGNGIRLLGSRLAIRSRDGHGGWVDELVLSTQGLGNDPYQFANLRIAKNGLYRYDMVWRLSEYFNPALAVTNGQHAIDTTRQMQDHDFTLFPQGRVRFFAGFSRSLQEGPALTTVNAFDVRGDEFPLFSNVHRRQNEFRYGNELKVFGVKINWMQSWELYREEMPVSLDAPSAGTNPSDRTVLNGFLRSNPYHGSTPSFRLNLFREKGEHWAVNGRFTWSAGSRGFALDETALGGDRFGGARNRQVLVTGDARRPVATGNLTLSLFPTSKLTIANHTGFHSTRMEGDSSYVELENASLTSAQVNFDYLGIRNITNVTDAQYEAKPWITIRGGYQYANRQIRSIEQLTVDNFPASVRTEQTNVLNAGVAGVRLRPLKPWTIAVDGELGRQDKPFFPTSEKNYHAVSARTQWRQGPLTLSALARSYTNSNSTSLFAHSARTRQYSFDGSWTPRDWFSVDAGYSKLHSYTATGLAYFLASALVEGDQSLFLSNLHTGHLGAHFSIRNRVDLYAGLSITRDAGGNPRGGSALPVFQAVQTFPMEFDAPLARISVKILPKLRWNAGYQYYRYREDLLPLQNYRANTGYTSVLWTF
ncbi:hypothetical protein [uncultured Paludibaculum sp.]|uniref:hypothetical protein n=1 Tax=uncultured Paludibaculum sp. TaxID=1765020 RepID=UPI002AAA8D18|nr:hypothetical protein [uncultured Paludibaculum sp.]